MPTKPVRASAPGPGLLRALESFVAETGGQVCYVSRGDLIESDHPLVQKHPHLFAPIEARWRIEQATAAPGEKRGDA